MRFPYQAYPVRGLIEGRLELVHRPMVFLRIVGPVGDALVFGLLDTGADDTLLPEWLLGPLGFPIRSGRNASIAGIGGARVVADFAEVDLELARGRAVYRWAATVGFYQGDRVILGQTGFLEHFAAGFNHRLRRATLRPSGVFPMPRYST